ncbi:acetylornithine/N-succinyldiaminopimelate aminotransferase [Acetitomaculum ruminis DSM 5522]|uniref:Acetylornithine aminotransferase n=1 Tax=Acetitomaculum ruminis DSM 5522 TaxID=1120918 RepID=A0A1I1AGR9_9FIRM|nr:aspartate aminotransferase family protein [Acetitomaculum ruminis]SFB37215.1 acetylornithine/N-succinyldiaminopimelate aminotransferase [Acetitomaculum ruminis DSM 5522]
MNKSEVINTAENCLLKTYNRFPKVLDHGEGVYLYDNEGNKYLDFASGIGVMALGYANKEYNDALKAQIDKLMHTSNLYYHEPGAKAAKTVCEKSKMDRVFFTNSGAEAIEGAIKTARKYAYTKDKSTDHEIIAMNSSFHGRTMGALSITGNTHYQEAFKPLIGNVKFADFNDLDSVLELVNEKTCGIIVEPIQGEGGIHPASKVFLEGIRKICDQKDILLIFDEIQCGMGRTGDLFAYESFGIKPDIIAMAKALGCGVPVGAFLMTQKVADKGLVPGDHGSTYGGNPFVCAAVEKVFEIYEKNNITNHVKQITPYLEETLEKLTKKHGNVIMHRGMGFMQGLVLKEGAADVVNKALDKGLICITAEKNVVRLLPPLIIEKEHIDEMARILDEVL